jgi:hypothetical protein
VAVPPKVILPVLKIEASQPVPMLIPRDVPALPPVSEPMFKPVVTVPATVDSVDIGVIFMPFRVPPVVNVLPDKSTDIPFSATVLLAN